MFRIVGCILLSFSSAIAADEPAEFAIRWDPTNGGPRSAAEVIDQLRLPAPDEAEEYRVSYFSVTAPADLPAGYAVIARQRTKGKKTQLTIKYRGSQPLPETFDANAWQCPLGADAATKYEVDVTLLQDAEVKKAYSLSCSVKAREKMAFPSRLNPKQLGCESDMRRYESNGLKIEEWTFYPDQEKLIEVSKSAEDNQDELDRFNTGVVSPLILSGVKPMISSKSSAGADCQK
ncbi:hypothetical protein [Methylomonas sp. MgM2]